MSRLIVKNLPKDIKEDRLRSIFSSKGEITDLRLCKTKDGMFRRFGFIGFKTQEEADSAIKFFNNSYIDTSKIHIELARNLGDKGSIRPWSKYSEGSSAFQRNNPNKTEQVSDDKLSLTTSKESGSDELSNDPEFLEFLMAHKNRSTKSVGGIENLNLTEDNSKKQTKSKPTQNNKPKNDEMISEDGSSDNDSSGSEDCSSDKEEESDKEVDESSKNASNISDMDYLKSKIVSKTADQQSKEIPSKSFINNPSKEAAKSSKDKSLKDKTCEEVKPSGSLFTLKMRGLPFKAKEKHIKDFFSPVKCIDIRFIKNKKNQPTGNAFVDFKSKDDLEKALKRDKDYLEGRYIELFIDENKTIENKQDDQKEEKPWMKKLRENNNQDEEDESIGESGRLFLRNLAYSCTEEDIQKLFEPHGPLSEVNLPLDKVTSKTIGIGYVTFLMPEHAVKAFNQLDGSIFQGRLLHILPSKAKKSEQDTIVDESSYKKKNEAKKKSQSGSDHNWNTLFLGVNAVADAMADKYNTTKRGILDAESSNSLAVRMALGETQVVADTRKFLVENGVKLDVFGQPVSKRSKTVMIAKNLPYGTTTGELRVMFAPFGQLQRVILPPTGITALIEFQEPSFARKAFQKLAYTKFKNSLLYLEWAPVDVFIEGSLKEPETEQQVDEEKSKDEQESEAESEAEEQDGKTLFIKNLNFDTNEDTLKEKFSSAGKVKTITIAKKKDSKNKGALLSMGYGFVEFKKKSSALKALKELQHCLVDEHALELKISHRKSTDKSTKKKSSDSKQKSSKILVRNVPFEATTKELKELFSTFGEIKTLRLPKKMVGTGPHRGFAFVDFLTKQDAKRAFEALSTSTHLYGRRLVLEWAEEEDDLDTLRKRTAKHFQEPKKSAKKKKEMLEELMEM